MNRASKAAQTPIFLFFILSNALLITGQKKLEKWGIDPGVVIAGNAILFALNLITLLLFRKAMQAGNPNVFVRAMYLSFMIKLFASIIAVFIYFTVAKPNVNKPAVIFCMGLYIVYTVIEVSILTKLLRAKKNA